MENYSVYDVRLNCNTANFGGREWVVDGEYGFQTYPGDWPKEKAVESYRRGE